MRRTKIPVKPANDNHGGLAHFDKFTNISFSNVAPLNNFIKFQVAPLFQT